MDLDSRNKHDEELTSLYKDEFSVESFIDVIEQSKVWKLIL